MQDPFEEYPDVVKGEMFGFSVADQSRLMFNKSKVETPFAYFEILYAPKFSDGQSRYVTAKEMQDIVLPRLEKLKQSKPEFEDNSVLYAVKRLDGTYRAILYKTTMPIKFGP